MPWRSPFAEEVRLSPAETDAVVDAIEDALAVDDLTIDELSDAVVERVGPWAVAGDARVPGLVAPVAPGTGHRGASGSPVLRSAAGPPGDLLPPGTLAAGLPSGARRRGRRRGDPALPAGLRARDVAALRPMDRRPAAWAADRFAEHASDLTAVTYDGSPA